MKNQLGDSPTCASSPHLLAPPCSGVRPRKYSLPVIIPRQSLSVYAEETQQRRKWSHRPSAYSLVAWRSGGVSQRDVVNQAKALCGRYLRTKLRQCSAVHKKLGLQRLKSVSNLASGSDTAEIANELRLLAGELESSHPKLFGSVSANLGMPALPASEAAVHSVFAALARALFERGCTWGRVAALFALTGALALDCVRAGRPDYVLGLVQRVGLFVEEGELAPWICQQGGWATLLTRFKNDTTNTYFKEAMCSFCAVVAVFILWWIFL